MDLLHDRLFEAAMAHPGKVAVCSEREERSFEQFADRVESLAAGLDRLGLRKGNRVSILAHNCMDYLAYHYATSILGVILHVMNTRHVVREWLWAMNDAGTSALIVDEAHAGRVPELRSECPSLRFSLGIGSSQGLDFTTDELVAPGQRARNLPRVASQDPLLLIYTSGTTGLPKGCLQTQVGSTTVDDLTADAMEATHRDVYIAIMPYFHQAGMIRTRATMTRGGTNVVPETRKIDEMADLMSEKKVTISMLVSAQQALLLLDKAKNQNVDYSAFRLLISGGGLGGNTMRMLKAVCDALGCEFMGIWGQTECTGPVTVVKGNTAFENPKTCGKPMEGIELEIWDKENARVPAHTTGEIMVRSAMTTRYWNNDDANRALYTGEWLHTGDLGKLDEQGYLYFVDREKDLVKSGGENVYPKEVEDVLSEHPSISEVTVIGVPDPKWGEAVTAVAVLKGEDHLTLEEVRAFCRDKIAGYKIPKGLEVVTEIPKNATGKVLKSELRERFLGSR